MAETICDTSPLQYLHQLGTLALLQKMAGRILVPQAVANELQAGRELGHDIPDVSRLSWVEIVSPVVPPVLRVVKDLGLGEKEALALALERKDCVLLLDDDYARRHAKALTLRFTGTLGFLVNAKHAGLISTVSPLLDQLDQLGFRSSPSTRRTVLTLANEL